MLIACGFVYLAAGSGDGKIQRHDAQSPTVQGTQSTQSQQQATSSTGAYVTMPPGYHPNIPNMPSAYYYPSAQGMVPGPYTGMFQVSPQITKYRHKYGLRSAWLIVYSASFNIKALTQILHGNLHFEVDPCFVLYL